MLFWLACIRLTGKNHKNCFQSATDHVYYERQKVLRDSSKTFVEL